PADRRAVVADVLAVARPLRGERRRVAVFKRLDVVLDELVDGGLVGLALGVLGSLVLRGPEAETPDQRGQEDWRGECGEEQGAFPRHGSPPQESESRSSRFLGADLPPRCLLGRSWIGAV